MRTRWPSVMCSPWSRAGPLLLMLLLALRATAAPTTPETRVALVIGNAAYAAPAALSNPVNDARAMARTLRKLGFSVVELHDANRQQMLKAVDDVAQTLRGRQGIGLLFYAGHGLQLDWHNFMVPVDARLTSSADIARQTIDVDVVIQAFKSAGNRMNVVILDACRDNPLASAGKRRGLAQVDAPPGTLLAYATAPGNVADDGPAGTGHGLYTRFLLQEIVRPAPIEAVFKRVRLHVRQASQGRQIPWESTSLEEDFTFDNRPRAASGPGTSRDAEFARQKAEWDRIKGSRNPDDFFAFLQRYPNGFISEQAAFMLEQLAARQTAAQPDRAGLRQNLRQARFRVGDSVTTRTLDTRSGREIDRNTLTVQRIEGARVHLKGTRGDVVRTLDGGFVHSTNREGSYSWDPPRLDLPGDEMKVGKRWTSRSLETFERNGKRHVNTREDRIRIVAQEEVTVPAGTFVAYKFVLESRLGNGITVKRTYWAQPGWAHYLKVEREVHRPGQPPVLETIETVSRSLGR